MLSLSRKWQGPVYCGAAILMWTLQAYLYSESGAIYLWLTIGGIAIFLIGLASWFYYFDDKRADLPLTADEASPTADEFERRFRE